MNVEHSDDTFDPSNWIKKGKVYKDVPISVANALLELRKLPPAFDALLVHRDTPILEFIEQKIPRRSSTLNTLPIKAWFSQQPPTHAFPDTILNIVTRRAIPPDIVLLEIERALGQEWLNGCRSLVDPRYNKGAERFPFWILTLWRRVKSMAEKQEDWKVAVEFLVDEVVEERGAVKEILGGVGWDSELKSGGFTFTTHRFAQLLSKNQLCDDVTQVMIDHLQERLEKTSHEFSQDIIATSRFYMSLEALANPKRNKKDKVPALILAVEDTIKNEGKTHLWYPVLHSSHEVVIQINFEQRTIAYGQ